MAQCIRINNGVHTYLAEASVEIERVIPCRVTYDMVRVIHSMPSTYQQESELHILRTYNSSSSFFCKHLA